MSTSPVWSFFGHLLISFTFLWPWPIGHWPCPCRLLTVQNLGRPDSTRPVWYFFGHLLISLFWSRPPFCGRSRPPIPAARLIPSSAASAHQTCLVGGHFWGRFPRLRQGHGHQCQLPYVVNKVYFTKSLYTQRVPASTIYQQKLLRKKTWQSSIVCDWCCGKTPHPQNLQSVPWEILAGKKTFFYG